MSLGHNDHLGVSDNSAEISAAEHVAFDGDGSGEVASGAIADNHFRVGIDDVGCIAAAEHVACILGGCHAVDVVDGEVVVCASDGAFEDHHLRGVEVCGHRLVIP